MLEPGTIAQQQNSVASLRLLAASSAANHGVRRIEVVRMASLACTSAAAAVAAHYEFLSPWSVVLAALVAVASEVIWPVFIARRRLEAVLILEEFDRQLYGLTWNGSLGDRVAQVRVTHLALQGAADRNLRDWYRDYGPAPHAVAVLRCQLETAHWSLDLRRRYVAFLGSVLAAIVLGELVLALAFELTVSALLLTVMVPSVPLVGGLVSDLCRQWRCVQAKERLRGRIETRLGDVQRRVLTARGLAKLRDDAGVFQDEVFLSRVSAPRVPKWFYLLLRSRQARVFEADSAQ